MSIKCANGSWAPESDAWGKRGGRVMTTSLSCLTLEIYYRYAPLYGENSGQPNVNAQAIFTDSFEESLKREQSSGLAPVREPEPGLQLNSLLSYLSIQLQPCPNPGLTDIQHSEAEKNRVQTVYSDFYRKYGGRRVLSTFVIDNVSEVPGQSRFRLMLSPNLAGLAKKA